MKCTLFHPCAPLFRYIIFCLYANVMLVDVNGSSASPVCYRSHYMKNIWKKYLEYYDKDKLTLETKQNTSQVGRKNIAICVTVLRSHTHNSYVSVVPLITQWSQWHYMLALRWRHNERGCVSNHQPHDCLLNRLFRHRSKKTSKLRATGLCAGNSSGTGEFPAQMASNAEDVSIWWRHHGWILVWYHVLLTIVTRTTTRSTATTRCPLL